MKKRILVVSVLIAVCSLSVVAQPSVFRQKELPKMLQSWPISFRLSTAEMNQMLQEKSQTNMHISLDDRTQMELTFVKRQQWEDGSETIAYVINNLPKGTLFNVNKTYKNGKVLYRAHIVNHAYSDAYQLTSFNEREFVFTKTDTENIVVE